MHREFSLTEEDEDSLNSTGLVWETIIEGNVKWLILRQYPIPGGYNLSAADAALRIPPSYPDGQIDMVYFHPALALTTGRSIQRLTPHLLENKQYQQWSRHRTAANPWRPGLDNVCTHLLQVDSWLNRELPKAVAA
jgi:hypothetical protein